MIILEKWYGRLGNNIIELSNIIDIALFYKHNIQFKVSHKLFDLKIIHDYFSQYKNDKVLKNDSSFFYKQRLPFPREIYNDNNPIKINLLKQAFLVKDINKLDEDDVVIHIRSGDIFKGTPHPIYTPPPLSFYEHILNKHNYRNIIILCEDRVNPVVDELLKIYENSSYCKNTLEDDIKILLGATNVISSVGTFVPSLLLLSEHVKYHYSTHSSEPQLKDYYSSMKPWKNTPSQRSYILNYRIPESFDISPKTF